MISPATFTRRDPRHALRPGSCFVDFPGPLSDTEDASAPMTHISVAGLAFQTAVLPGLEAGSIVEGVTVRVGDCRIEGDIVVQYVDPTKTPGAEIGCVFHPAGDGNADRLMALIAGIEAARAGV